MPGPLVVAQTYNSPHPRSQHKRYPLNPSPSSLFSNLRFQLLLYYTLNKVYKLPVQLCHCAFCLVANKVAGPPNQLYYSFVGRAAPPPIISIALVID